jgi:hypothetical protein
VGDAPMLPELLSQIPPDQEIASVTADGACDTRTCHDAIAERGATAFGHALERYHRRSRAVTKMHGFRLLRQRLSAVRHRA